MLRSGKFSKNYFHKKRMTVQSELIRITAAKGNFKNPKSAEKETFLAFIWSHKVSANISKCTLLS